jgi:uncharacterized protein YlxW (UPF0749 family)
MNKELILKIIIENDYNSCKHKTFLNTDKINLTSIAKSLNTSVVNVRNVVNSKDKYIKKYNLSLELKAYEEVIEETLNDLKKLIKDLDNYIDNYQF